MHNPSCVWCILAVAVTAVQGAGGEYGVGDQAKLLGNAAVRRIGGDSYRMQTNVVTPIRLRGRRATTKTGGARWYNPGDGRWTDAGKPGPGVFVAPDAKNWVLLPQEPQNFKRMDGQ